MLSTYWETEADVTVKGLDGFFGAVTNPVSLMFSMAAALLQIKTAKAVKIMNNAQNKVCREVSVGVANLQLESLWGDVVTAGLILSITFYKAVKIRKIPMRKARCGAGT